jgi:hypothetical protein
MTHYVVTWQIDIEAETPGEAAKKALAIHRDPDSTATVFDVYDQSAGAKITLDLTEDRPGPVDWRAVPKQALIDALRNSQLASIAPLGRQDKADLVRDAERILKHPTHGGRFRELLAAETAFQGKRTA